MNVWAFDLATKTGAAMGPPPADLSRLNSYSVDLKTESGFADEDADIAHRCLNLRTFLGHRLKFKSDRPDIIVFEAPFDANASPRDKGEERPRNAMSHLLPCNLVTTLRLKAFDYGIPVVKVWPSTIRANFLEKPNAGERRDTKKAVIERCRVWGYVPSTCKDDNRCDAIAMWHWAQTTRGGWRPPYEVIMGRRVPVVARPSVPALAEAQNS